jgi:hypothetical protein
MIPLAYLETSSSSKYETEIDGDGDGDGEMKNDRTVSSTNNISAEDRVRSEISEKRHNAMETLRFKVYMYLFTCINKFICKKVFFDVYVNVVYIYMNMYIYLYNIYDISIKKKIYLCLGDTR